MKKNIYLLVMSALFVWGCESNKVDISMELEKLAVSHVTDTVRFRLINLIKEDFDSYLIVPPYTNIKKAEEKIGIEISKINETGIDIRDDIYVLCLFKDNTMTNFYELSRNTIDYSELSDLSLNKKEVELILVKQLEIYHITKASVR